MADCKDCIKNDVCELYVHLHCKDYKENKCKHFKSKIDFVEVVRCKDCKKFIKKGEEFLNNDVFGICEKSRTGFFDDGEEVYGNDFCSYGERKTVTDTNVGGK